ncbi:MAG: Ig-like domain-containing protein [Thermodesulfovibrionales bacterium]
MMKRLLFITVLAMVAALFAGCGGGDSTSSAPVGVNPGVASRVELMATSYVNQTNSYCFFKAKVIDGNGVPMQGREVIFTNLSLTGVLDFTTAVTGANGIATVTLYSTSVGFATVQAEVNAGTEKIRDRKTVFFSPFDIGFPGAEQVPPALVLDVDSDNDGIFNEANDFIMLDPAGKTDAIIRATVTDNAGAPVLNSEVTFGADSPEVTFPLGSSTTAPVVFTNSDGQASVLARISPVILRTTDSTVNITAAADNGTFNVLTLFLKPVTVSTISVIAVPSTVASAGTSAITAAVTTTAGTPVPDGTSVNFSVVGGGSITPFGQTTAGLATATYTAPTVTANTSASIRASVGSVIGATTVTITAPVVPPAALAVAPATGTASSAVGAALAFAISGGTGPYAVTSSTPASACNDAAPANGLCSDLGDTGTWTVTTASPTFLVAVPIGAPVGTVILSISDSSTPAKTATVVITIGP